MTEHIVLSHLQVQPLLDARRLSSDAIEISPDLGLSTVRVAIEAERAVFPDGQWLSWDDLATIAHDAPICFAVEENKAHKINRFSRTLHRAYSLMATKGAPTIINSGFTMHRIVGVDPLEDTRRKIRALGAPHGTVLDTATGLGYTAIEAARTATRVITIEIDPLVLEIARLNPYSRALFDNSSNRVCGIEQRIGDSAEIVTTFQDEQFAHVIHDPPTVSLAGDLYGGAFYRQLYRVLRRGGTLFHYVGNLESKQGNSVVKGVLRRLHEAGFTRVTPSREGFGLVATKGGR